MKLVRLQIGIGQGEYNDHENYSEYMIQYRIEVGHICQFDFYSPDSFHRPDQ